MLVSVIIPAYEAEGLIARTVRSVLSQTYRELELVLVSDDQRDYLEVLASRGISDPRVRQISTGKYGGGAHRARNHGLDVARGELITHFDADDVMQPTRLEKLVPLAAESGAAYDWVAVVDEQSGDHLYTALESLTRMHIEEVFTSATPLIPLTRREHAAPRTEDLDLAEDVIANILLLDKLGPVPVHPEALWQYRIARGSMSHVGDSAAKYDEHYALIQTMLPMMPLSRTNRAMVNQGFIDKRALNSAYGKAAARHPGLTFQDYIAALRRGEDLAAS